MSENHTHDMSGKRLATAFFINLFFTIIELIGGIIFNSYAILADAIHDLGDSVSLGTAWYFQKISRKKRNNTFTYGYKRFSVLGAIINVIVLATGSIIIVVKAIEVINSGDYEPVPEGMIGLSILGILFNGIAVYKMQGGRSLNEKVISLHLLEDVLGWVAVLVASIIIYFWDLPILDPVLSILVSVYIFYNAIRNLITSIMVMLQASPHNVDCIGLEQEIKKIDGVKSIRDLHVWSLDGEHNIMTIHIEPEGDFESCSQKDIKSKIREFVKTKKVNHITIEFEGSDEKTLLKH